MNVNDKIIKDLSNMDCLIIDTFEENIDEKLFYSILSQSKQLDNYILINSLPPIADVNFQFKDLQSRINSF